MVPLPYAASAGAGKPSHLSQRSSIPTAVHDLDLSGQVDRSIPDLYDLYGLAYLSVWEPYNLHDLQ